MGNSRSTEFGFKFLFSTIPIIFYNIFALMKKSLQMGSFCTMFFLTAYVFQFILINQSQVATLLKLRVANSAFAVILDDCLTDP